MWLEFPRKGAYLKAAKGVVCNRRHVDAVLELSVDVVQGEDVGEGWEAWKAVRRRD